MGCGADLPVCLQCSSRAGVRRSVPDAGSEIDDEDGDEND